MTELKLMYKTLVDRDHILGFTLKVLDGLDPDGIHSPSVSTQLSVIAWNQYEHEEFQRLLAGQSVEDKEIALEVAGSLEYQTVLAKRGTLISEFEFTYDGVIVSLYERQRDYEDMSLEEMNDLLYGKAPHERGPERKE